MVSSSHSTCQSELTTAVIHAAGPALTPGGAPCTALGRIVCTHVAGQSVLTTLHGGNPLKLIPQCGRGPTCTVCVATYGGGFVAGDQVAIDVHVEADARLVLSTQANSKVYRSDSGAYASNTLTATVADHGILALLPDPTTAFAQARFRQRQLLTLSDHGNAIVLDWLTAGRMARNETWAFDHVSMRTQINRGGHPWLIEALDLTPAAAAHMRGVGCIATLIVAGPDLAAWAADLRDLGHHPIAGDANGLQIAVCARDEATIVRLSAPHPDPIWRWIKQACGGAHSMLGIDPWQGRR